MALLLVPAAFARFDEDHSTRTTATSWTFLVRQGPLDRDHLLFIQGGSIDSTAKSFADWRAADGNKAPDKKLAVWKENGHHAVEVVVFVRESASLGESEKKDVGAVVWIGNVNSV